MSNPFGEDDIKILEGFLCPICKEDLKTPERLTSHVENVHSEEQDILKSLKDIFGRAKKKILNLDESIDLTKTFDVTLKLPQPYYILEGPQEVGVDVDHFPSFKAIRTPRLEHYATETNKLIIRLHKLITDRPTELMQIRQFEKDIVPWLDGKSVKLCPSCAKNFHLARRQHHCRLCGSIMCHDCSHFLDLNIANEIVNPSGATTPIKTEPDTDTNDKEKSSLRICDHCLHLLENRKDMQDSQTYRPPVTKLYAKIQELKKEIAPDIPMYNKMVNSLYEGDSIFTIADAGALRAKIGRVAEMIENLSKSILVLPTPQGSREEALKKSLRLASIAYIKEDLLSLPQLPLETEIKKLQEKRRQDTEMRIIRERRLALEAFEKYELENANSQMVYLSQVNTTDTENASGSTVTSLDNWSGQHTNTMTLSDPLVEQIVIIKGYIKQARQALRFDEVAILEMNLRELQQEFYERQQNT